MRRVWRHGMRPCAADATFVAILRRDVPPLWVDLEGTNELWGTYSKGKPRKKQGFAKDRAPVSGMQGKACNRVRSSVSPATSKGPPCAAFRHEHGTTLPPVVGPPGVHQRRWPIRCTGPFLSHTPELEPESGFEPLTCALRVRCSTD